jgi:hypothetical protein
MSVKRLLQFFTTFIKLCLIEFSGILLCGELLNPEVGLVVVPGLDQVIDLVGGKAKGLHDGFLRAEKEALPGMDHKDQEGFTLNLGLEFLVEVREAAERVGVVRGHWEIPWFEREKGVE